MADANYIDSCIDLYEKISKKWKEVTSGAIESEVFDNYIHELNPDTQMCIDTIYVIGGWMAFGGVKEKSEYPEIRIAIVNLASYIAEDKN